MFDYVNEATERVDLSSGKTLAEWDVRIGGNIAGGVATTMKALNLVQFDKLKSVSTELFHSHTDNGV